MTQPDLQCPDCSTAYEHHDNYCRKCGMYLAAMRASTLTTTEPAAHAVEPVRASLPAPVKKAATALAIGTALQIGVGLAGKYLANQAARSATTAVTASAARPVRRGKSRGRDVQPAEAESDPLANAAAVSETVLIRRVWIRRD